MVLYVQHLNGHREHYVLSEDLESWDKLFHLYPQVRDLFSYSKSVDDAAQRAARYLSRHNMTAWVEEDNVSKSLRNKAAAVGLAAATLLTPNMAEPKQPTSSQHHHLDLHAQPKQYHETKPDQLKTPDFGKQPEDKFLWSIMQVESSGGKDTHHKVAGRIHTTADRAIGKWGLLKPTVDEVISRHRIKDPIPEGERLIQFSRDDLEQYLKNRPDLELTLARALARHVIHRQHGDLRRSAYAWLYGHNKHYDEIPDQVLQESDYVKKFRDYHKRNPFNPIRPSVHAVKKSEGPEMFKDRIKTWSKKREAEEREPQPMPSNYSPDPGRLREKELDEKPVTNPKDVRPYLKQKIKDAKDSIKT